MRAPMIRYNDDGKTLKKVYVEVDYRWSWSKGNPPVVEIELPEKTKSRHTSILISARQLENQFRKHGVGRPGVHVI